MRSRVLVVAGLSLLACDRAGVHHTGPAKLSVQPATLDFGLTWVGHPQDQVLTVSNDGNADAVATVVVAAPFSVDQSTLDVAIGSHSTLTVHYAPTKAGHDIAMLTLGGLVVQLQGDARVEPECAPKLCNDAFFDTLSRACAWKPLADGTACHTGCTAGSCLGGECLGSPLSCDDGNACTVDGCSEPGGCTHTPETCAPPSDPCHAGMCDPVSGCTQAPVADGTSCGEDLCASSTAAICISGACVRRPRMPGTRCENQWVRPYMDTRQWAGFTWDSTRRRAVEYGGWDFRSNQETWEWDFGTGWQQVFPAHTPDVYSSTLGYDPDRQRTVLFSGETWEYDGTDWTQRLPAHSPPPLQGAVFVYDSTGQRLILYGGNYCTPYCVYPTDFWEWDGTDWTNVVPPGVSPPNKRSFAIGYDEYRSRLVVFGGTDLSGVDFQRDLWEFDGTAWAQIAQPDAGLWPQGAYSSSLVFDEASAQLILYSEHDELDGGALWAWNGTRWTEQTFDQGPRSRFWDSSTAFDQTTHSLLVFSTPDVDGGFVADWQWDGGQWSTVTRHWPARRSRASLAYDSARDEVVMFGGYSQSDDIAYDQTWLWNGAHWSLAPSDHSPRARLEASMTFDSSRGVVVLFGGFNYGVNWNGFGDTWEWNGTAWTETTPAQSPPSRYGAAIAYDSVRQKVMLFGGYSEQNVQPLRDLWEYDGTTWNEVMTFSAPAARVGARMVYDEAHQQLVLMGGTPDRLLMDNFVFQDIWVFDGTDWTDHTPVIAPTPRARFGMAYDRTRQRIWAFGGWTLSTTYPSAELNDTLQWDGTTWQTVTPLTSPPPLGGIDMVYDPTRDELLFMGGAGDDEYIPSDATWVYGPPP